MRFIKTLFPLGFLVLLICILAACGSTSSSNSSSYATSSPTTTPDTSATGPTATTTGKYYATPTTSTSNTNVVTIKTTTVTISGKAETILTNAQGMTLYYFMPDTKTTPACTSGCTGTWPPLLTTGSGTPTSTTTLQGKLTALASTNGTQVQYNSHFLYTYAGDSTPGQTNGQGIGGKWFVATTSLM